MSATILCENICPSSLSTVGLWGGATKCLRASLRFFQMLLLKGSQGSPRTIRICFLTPTHSVNIHISTAIIHGVIKLYSKLLWLFSKIIWRGVG